MITRYHAKYYAQLLSQKSVGNNLQNLSQSLLNSAVDINPHQIDAALFAFKSPLSKGVVLADEVGLGKTIEAGLVLCQMWSTGKRKIIIVCPASLRKQWSFELAEKFEARQQEKKTEIDEKAEEKGSVLKDLKDKQKEAAAKPPVKDAAEKAAKSKGYKTTSTKKSVLKYVTDDVNLDDGQGALSVTIPHSSLQTVKYVYDEQNQVYKRYARNKAQTDWDTGNSITTKNIIITMCDNYTLEDSENKGRQGLKNIGTFNGYYITNGKAIKIKCIKESRNAQTKYQDLQGNEIKVNDGNTWINICPTNAKIVIEGPATETGVDTTNNV